MTKVFVDDSLKPEDNAMLQALYSRSSDSAKTHLEEVVRRGSAKFMKRYYVGYNHKSIGDCGTSTGFLEGVSMLCAKAIQDNELYSGQESSTRYIDFSNQPIIDPVGSKESRGILDAWIEFYTESQPPLIDFLKQSYPIQEGEKEKVYDNAIKARCFDILRAFLPAGCTTQLSWHSNLRQFGDKIALLRHHPLEEIREVSKSLHAELMKSYPNSFSDKTYEDQEAYNRKIVRRFSFFEDTGLDSEDRFFFEHNVDVEELRRYKDVLQERPEKTNLPLFLKDLGNCSFRFLIDFGSFRDVQRHRNGICRMPFLSTDIGFGSWYLNQLPDELRLKANDLIKAQRARIKTLTCSPFDTQYYVAMGFLVPCRVTYGLPASVYVTELRSGSRVHPTLRDVAHNMHSRLAGAFPDLKLHSDLGSHDFDIKRGLDVITKLSIASDHESIKIGEGE